MAWLPDGTGLVVVAQERVASPYQVWLVEFPSGAARRLTNDLLDYDKVSLSADGRLLLIQQETIAEHVWLIPAGDAARARQLTFGVGDRDGSLGLAWTQDGKIVFASARSGAYDIWTMSSDGSGATTHRRFGRFKLAASPNARRTVHTLLFNSHRPPECLAHGRQRR